ncbi:MAG TPA: hypothetical protein VFU94_10485, partial [Conexibacter sp.]|nr:hypothetical protein [Conexibacter sp.]
LRVAVTIQLALAAVFLVAALALHHPLKDKLLGGSSTLYWVLIGAVLGYAASYFARGFLAGHRRFGLYGGLVFMEAISRFMFAFVVAVGIFLGQSVVALGMVAAPLFSLSVVPWAVRRSLKRADPVRADTDEIYRDEMDAASSAEPNEEAEFTLSHGTGFAAAVLLIMISEQTFLNAGPLLVKATEGAQGAAIAGFVFNALLIARAPLQLFQAVQTSILPNLTAMAARGSRRAFDDAVRKTVLVIAGFAGACALGLLAIGPAVMTAVLKDHGFRYERGGLALVAIGMGFHLVAGTLNQAALARNRAALAAAAWAISAVLFVAWMLTSIVSNEVLRVETGYFGATFVLSGLLLGLHRRA